MADYGNEISSISLGSIIGGALSAIVEAQSQAAHTTVNFINEVGFEGKQGERKPVYIDFHIRVDDATIDFNVKINSVQETKTSSDLNYGGKTEAFANYNGFRFKTGIKLSASISNQKKSSTSDTVKRDYSLNIHVHAKQDDMPAGVEHLLDLLSDASSTNTYIEKISNK